MNYLNHFSSLFQKLKKEYSIFQSLIKSPNPKTISIQNTKNKINKLLELLKSEIITLNNILLIKRIINRERQKSEILKNKKIQIQNLIHDSILTLTQNIPFFTTTSSLSSNRFCLNSLSKIDLINMATRINTQYIYPEDVLYIPSNAFLKQYPTEDIQMKYSILKYDLRDSKRLKPPNANPKGGEVSKGTLLLLTPDESDVKRLKKSEWGGKIFFKYSMNDSIPSTFSGELYSESTKIILDKDCIIKVCACKDGFKDSEIVNYVFKVSNEQVIKQKPINNNKIQNFLYRPDVTIQSGSGYVQEIYNDDGSPKYGSVSGSAYQPSLYNPDNNDDDEI